MHKTVFFIILFFSFFSLFAQNYQLEWQQCFGGSEEDLARNIIAYNGIYYIVGGTSSSDGDVSFNNGTTDAWIIKIDTIGNILWEKTYGGSHGEWFTRMIPTSNNMFYLIGSTASSDGDISFDPYPDSRDIWVVKIDSSGNILWDKVIGGGMIDAIESATITNDGGVAIFGWTGSQNGDVSVNYGLYDMWLAKLNSNGEIEWNKSFGTDDFDYGRTIIQTSDSGFLVGGTSTIGNGGNLTCEPFNYNAEAILLKLDSFGNIEWQQCYGGSSHDGFMNFVELNDGYLLLGYGESQDGNLTGSGWHGESDIWVIRVDNGGDIIWQKCYGGSRFEFSKNIFVTNDGAIYIFGNTESNNGDVSGNHTLSEFDADIWMLKLNNEGELLYQQCFGGVGNETIEFGVVEKSDNDFVLAAQTDYGPSFDVSCTPHGGNTVDNDYWVFEIKDCDYYGAAVPETPVGNDTVCVVNNLQTGFTIPLAARAWYYEWKIAPQEAGTIAGDSITGTVQWATDYEGTATIMVRSVNDCGKSTYSQPHFVQVYSCIGVEEFETDGIRLKVYPNPARGFVVFDVQGSKFEVQGSKFEGSGITIMDIYGQKVAELQVRSEKTVWQTDGVEAGLYFYRVETGGKVVSGKVMVMR